MHEKQVENVVKCPFHSFRTIPRHYGIANVDVYSHDSIFFPVQYNRHAFIYLFYLGIVVLQYCSIKFRYTIQ